jgi:asparagine synthase (glutamine-hydrolysing)
VNILTGRIRWDYPLRLPGEVAGKRYDNGKIEVWVTRIPCLRLGSDSFFHNPRRNLVVGMIGYISNLERLGYSVLTEDVEVVAQLYQSYGLDFIYHIDGVYSIFIFDGMAKMGYVFQDPRGSNIPFYFWNSEKELCFSCSLKSLLKISRIERKLDIGSAITFLSNRYLIPNEHTLIEGMKKLSPGRYISIDLNRNLVQIHFLQGNRQKEISKKDAKKCLIKSVEQNLTALAARLTESEITMALSAGFDTNLLLCLFKKVTDRKINAISVGGIMRSETELVREIIAFYSGVNLIEKIVPSDAAEKLPDIVWRLEGHVFQKGVFLQYEIGKTLESAGAHNIFLGEGADQELDAYRHSIQARAYKSMRLMLKKSPLGPIYYTLVKRTSPESSYALQVASRFKRFCEVPDYDADFEMILKKNGIMLNSFGVQGLYPFLNEETRSCAIALGKQNWRKEYYKKQVRDLVGDRVSTILRKIGGSTDVEYLTTQKKEVLLSIFDSKFISNLIRPFFNTALCEKIRKKPEEYSNFLLQLAFVYLFNRLFLNREFDTQLDQNSFGIPLSAVI